MTRITSYARPASLAEALELLEPGDAIAIGGGTTLPRRQLEGTPGVVDLQDLGLGTIERSGDTARLGATATLDELCRADVLPLAVREAARRELPSSLRTQATLGGLVAAGCADSELLAVLLVHEAVVSVATREALGELPLETYLASLPRPHGEIITTVAIDLRGRSAAARTGRTRADRPIVAAAARRAPDDTRRLALCGVAATPVLVDVAALHALHPPGDFRGSSDYRAALAEVLSRRVLEEVS